MSSFGLWLYRVLTAWLPESRAFAWKRMWLRLAGANGRNLAAKKYQWSKAATDLVGMYKMCLKNNGEVAWQHFIAR